MDVTRRRRPQPLYIGRRWSRRSPSGWPVVVVEPELTIPYRTTIAVPRPRTTQITSRTRTCGLARRYLTRSCTSCSIVPADDVCVRPPLSGVRARKRPPLFGAASIKKRRRPTLPGPCEPSTIGAEGLNCSVRNGKRCFPLAIATANQWRPPHRGPSKLHSANARISNIRQALDPLVPVSCGCHHPSRSGLSTW